MTQTACPTTARDEITATIEHYVTGGLTGDSDRMRRAFHDEATIFGYFDDVLFAGPIEQLFAWNEQNGAAPGLKARIASIDVQGSVATARVELDDWSGHRFTDLFTLLRVDGDWKIMNKVFHLHG